MITFDDPLIDGRIEQYRRDLDELTRQAMDGEIEEDVFRQRMERLVALILLLLFALSGADTATDASALAFLQEQTAVQQRAVRNLADDIFSGRYLAREAGAVSEGRPAQTVDEGLEKLANRLTLWVAAAAAMYSAGQVYQPPAGEQEQRRFRWDLGQTEKHCRDCLALNGVVLTADEWRQSGYRPQSYDLECRGFFCDCRWVETDEPSIGLGSVRV